MTAFSGTGVSAAQAAPAGGGDITVTLTNSSFVGTIFIEGSLDGGQHWQPMPTPLVSGTGANQSVNIPCPVSSMQVRLHCTAFTSGSMAYAFTAKTSVVLGRLHVGPSENGVSITTGQGAPTEVEAAGSIYIRADGSGGSRIYVNQGGGNWTAMATV